jgi:D-alanine-D-alanine ligase
VKITLMLGGPSAEREVSLKSGASVARALRSAGHHVTEIDPQNGRFKLPPQTDVVFLALHGTYGEDGTVQQQLEEIGVPYTGCGPEASRIAFDKILTKQRCIEAGVPTARFHLLRSAAEPWPEGWRPPVVLKPVRQGSSVGLQFLSDIAAWERSIADAFRFDSQVLMEEQITGPETTVAILDGKPLPVVEVRPKSGAYDYENKYTAGRTEYLCPAPLADEITSRLQSAALSAFNAVGARDYARVDIMLDAGVRPVVLEINTLPGMTETSLLPKAAAAAGLSYVQLCELMVELALSRRHAGAAFAK